MGTWIMLHYGGPIATGLKKSLCGLDLGEPETWTSTRQAATYRDYELLDNVPDNHRPCQACRGALDFWRTKELRARRDEWRDTIRRARKRIPLLMEAGKWRRVAKLATEAADALEWLKAKRSLET